MDQEIKAAIRELDRIASILRGSGDLAEKDAFTVSNDLQEVWLILAQADHYYDAKRHGNVEVR